MSVGTVVAINDDKCQEVADALRNAQVPIPKESVPALPFTSAQEANFWFFLVAICHQTSPIDGQSLVGEIEGQVRRGWDYLLHSFRLASIKDKRWLEASRWCNVNGNDISSLFGPNITEPNDRATLINDLGTKLTMHKWNSILNAGEYCGFRIAQHDPSLLSLLTDFKAYSDPVQKKSVFFLALMKNAGLWKYEDEEQLPAPVDYHEMRGHLRIGTVRVDAKLYTKVSKGEVITSDEDIALRSGIRDAIQTVSEKLGASPNALHYFFWNLFRTYCIRNTPKCAGDSFNSLPEVYQHAVVRSGGVECPFRKCCNSADKLFAINEPRVLTDFY